MSRLVRIRPGVLVVFGSSAIGGAAYRFFKSPSSSEGSLNPHTFTPYTLVDKQNVSPSSAIFTLRHSEGAHEPESVKEAWKRSVWSVQAKQPQLQIARAYTPLPPPVDASTESEETSAHVRLLIRAEEGGEVSTYLHGLPEKATIELRGPNVECELPHDIREVVFLAGGTGIAPAMQVAQAMARRTGSKMCILWANRRREECVGGVSDEHIPANPVLQGGSWLRNLIGLGQPPAPQPSAVVPVSHGKGVIVRELEALKERSRVATQESSVHQELSVQYYVDEEKTFIKPGDVAKRLHVNAPDEKGSRLILVSGPDGFIEHWAGKKLWVGGREVQGPLGGVLAQMDLKDWKVFKL
ncbi:hypothetical protein K458DRAFT_414278 [Lentithecium fluviatile CBS 122367]|uniref:FAD-binding FR-type domain-containing protein n=1 Tax=Lentithecium fluviatile CBS 122367 TaxID=1168545 RepID=A0A6G1JED4_9PLEO|nr:hypothetical protein K458DRAFT_414278 [Lentithecium fluviatile CBS 122367]